MASKAPLRRPHGKRVSTEQRDLSSAGLRLLLHMKGCRTCTHVHVVPWHQPLVMHCMIVPIAPIVAQPNAAHALSLIESMAYCRRVPAFPLESGRALFEETKASLDETPLTPATLDGLYSTMASIRRHLHSQPETAFKEVKTHAFLRKVLSELAGIDPAAMRTCATTGLVVDIKGCGPPASGPISTIALRSDIDALPMTELNKSLPYRSAHVGTAHLCGHDGHMASLIGAATLIQRRAKKLPSNMTVRLLFQPAEEAPGGAEPMIKEGCLEGVDECYGYHVRPAMLRAERAAWPALRCQRSPTCLLHARACPSRRTGHPSSMASSPSNRVRRSRSPSGHNLLPVARSIPSPTPSPAAPPATAGPVMAHPMTFTITITGKGGHGSQPQFAVDPVLTAAHVVVALQSVVSRSVPSGEQAVVSVCTINGGETFNVIPDQVGGRGEDGSDEEPAYMRHLQARGGTGGSWRACAAHSAGSPKCACA